MSWASAALVAAESILALTPVAIKKTPLDPTSAVWSRLLSTGALGWLMSGDRGLSRNEAAGGAALGYTNLIHVITSYESFRHLPAGQAMSLLYTYPLWNLVLNHLFRGTHVSVKQYALMTVAALGSIVLNMDPGSAVATPTVRHPDRGWGIFMGLVMALTESTMHVLLRGLGWRDPAKSVWVVNGGAAGWLALLQGLQAVTFRDAGEFGLQSGTWIDAAILTAFHGVSMFSGYWLRFFAVPRLSVVSYSVLSYAGLLASYLFGLFILGERPGWISIVGAIMILVSGVLLEATPQTTEGMKADD